MVGLSFNMDVFGDTYSEELQVVFENQSSADSIIALYPNISFERVIPLASDEALEARHRKSGLDLWYVAKMSSKDMTRSVNAFEKCQGIRDVYETQYMTLPEVQYETGFELPQQDTSCSNITRSGVTMNDPLYPRQWHYNMINLEDAWKLECGKRNVIVAVMDGWIDHTHPDLAPNMWVNEAELNGQPGVDDDGNGYIDDIYGYNASSDPDYYSEHGTHVAGTVAAVNNNGIGVCGVAGGNGIDSGVRVMSIGVVDSKNIADWQVARGYVYAADNGAVISQNSWEGNKLHQNPVMNEAINYFMENAGNKPDSPMKGGLVIFAAGNDNSNIPHYPLNGQGINRNRFITVGGVSADKIRTSFSNYGWWVDVAAPAGEQNGTSIMSTATEEGYMLMNGTSMACPHVSGVAALVVSKFQSPDLTPEFVRNRILSTASRIENYQAGYEHEAETSLGIVNAYAAVCDENEVKPEVPQNFTVKAYNFSDYGLFSWIMPADSNGNAPSVCKIYAGNQTVPYVVVKTAGAEVGSRFEYFDRSKKLRDCSEYTIEAVDCDGNRSDRSEISKVVDCNKDLAVINPYGIDDFVIYKPSPYGFTESFGDVTLEFYINNDVGIKMEIESPADFIKREYLNGMWVVTFDLSDSAPTGTFPFVIKVYEKDNPENVYKLPLSCTVRDALCRNNGVICTAGGKTITVIETTNRNGSISIDLTKYLSHPWGSNYSILDSNGMVEDDFFGFKVNYNVENGDMNASYNFEDALFSCSAEIEFETVDEYRNISSFKVEIKFIDEGSGIENGVSDPSLYKSGIYTTFGVKLDCEIDKLPPGLYIINGKKILITH